MNNQEIITLVTEQVLLHLQKANKCDDLKQDRHKIPLGISNRHVHISAEDLATLFGEKAQLTKQRDLSQPGQFVCTETVTLVGPKGVIEKVRVLGPLRKRTQVEVSISDCFKLGIKAPIRDSGDLEGSAAITIVGPVGSVTLKEGAIIAARHIHMSPTDAEFFKVQNGDRVNVKCSGPRGIVFSEVLARVDANFKLEMHLDIDEANAASLKNGDLLEII